MALFGDLGKFVSGTLDNPVFQTFFPVFALGNKLTLEAARYGPGIVGRSIKALTTPPARPAPPRQIVPSSLGYPTYYPPVYGGGSWDYSTQSPVFSTLPPTYQDQMSSGPSLGFSLDQWPEGFSR